jgi:hypothetical protein
MVRLGLPWRLVGTLLGVDVCPLLALLACLKREGSDSLLVNGGRGMVATSWQSAAVATRNLLA